MEQKKFMNISRLKESYEKGFQPGDMIVIQEKVDGSNASFRYDEESGKLISFSRNKTLDFNNTLNGYYNYVNTLNPEEYKESNSYVVFGEWTGAKNAIVYDELHTGKWYVYDIYDTNEEKYLTQNQVMKFVIDHGLTYVHTYYSGPFISWEHVMSFVGKPAYGPVNEGVVVKNQTRLNDPDNRLPFVVKIVGEEFHEIKKSNHIKKSVDPQKMQERKEAMEIVGSIVTRRRVEKELYKMRDEGIIPSEWGERDMQIIARTLPSRIYADCVKEEKETVDSAGQYFGKFCSSESMKHARNIVLGTPS